MNIKWLNTKVFQIIVVICVTDLRTCKSEFVFKESTDLDNNSNNTGYNNNNDRKISLPPSSSSVDTQFVDAVGNKYEAAIYNFCPPRCSCLNDFFECKRLGLKHVPALPGWVRDLELTGNKLGDDVQNSIGNLTELISLNLKKNRLHKIPVFKGLTSLEKLILAHNKIQAITPEALLSLPNLKELDLSRNQIQTILPNSFPEMNRLNVLNLYYNRLIVLEENSFDHLRSLTELQINHNYLRNLPNGVFKSLNILRKLDLSDNQINITWSTFRGLDDLRTLKLRANGILNLPDGVFHSLRSIATIELDSNRITSISRGEFFNLTGLQQLSLSNNTINRIEVDTWEDTQQLATLDLSRNRLTEIIRSNLECLTKLKKLNVAKNQIKHIEDGAFNCTKNLEQLNLSGNQLSWMIEDGIGPFSVLKKLLKIDLSDNNVKSINQKAFIGLKNLEVLNLQLNNLTSIQFNAFEPLESLQKVFINSTNFICDCNLHWLYTWLKGTRLTGQVSVICDYPLNLREKELIILKDEDFKCDESPKPRLITEPYDQLAIKGTNVTLECSAISSVPSEMTFQWRRDNVDIRQNETETQTITSNNNTIASSYLRFYNVNHDQHTGKYQCVVANSFGTTYSQKFKITVATFPKFRKIPSNVTLNSGTTARLDCSAFGEPTPQIAWQKDGGNDFPAARERRMHVMPSDHAFYIIDAKISDMGLYTCTAENPAGIIKANATLTVYEPPTFVKPMESKEVATGKSSVLECMTSGSPKPTLRWLKDDKPIRVTDRHFFAAEGQLLIIVDTVLSDAGRYKCEVKNELGIESGYLTLKVNKAASKTVVNVEEMTGIIIITVFCCAVGTSIIWVVIIYQTKKGNESNTNSNYPNNDHSTIMLNHNLSPNGDNATNHYIQTHLHDDATCRLIAQHQQQHQQSQPSQLYNSQQNSQQQQQPNQNNINDIPQIINIDVHDDIDRVSSKDSGTGDSAKRSNSTDDLTLNLNDSYLHLNDTNNYCQVDNFDKLITSCRSGTNSGQHSPYKIQSTNDNNQILSKKIDKQTLESSIPLITNDETNTNSIYVPQDTTTISNSHTSSNIISGAVH